MNATLNYRSDVFFFHSRSISSISQSASWFSNESTTVQVWNVDISVECIIDCPRTRDWLFEDAWLTIQGLVIDHSRMNYWPFEDALMTIWRCVTPHPRTRHDHRKTHDWPSEDVWLAIQGLIICSQGTSLTSQGLIICSLRAHHWPVKDSSFVVGGLIIDQSRTHHL